MKKRNSLKYLLPVLALVLPFAPGVGAADGSFTAYNTYEYNAYGESVPAPAGYVPAQSLSGEQMGLQKPLSKPADLYYGGGALYLLDSGNSRIVVLGSDLAVQNVYENLTVPAELSKNGFEEPLDLSGAQGITADAQKKIYIADTENERIVILENGRVVRLLYKPQTSLLDESVPFRVTKVAAGADGKLFAVAESINAGAFVFSAESYRFERFLGSNKVKPGAGVLLKYIQRRFLTRAQLAASVTYTPVTIDNFVIDSRGFLITVSNETGAESKVNRFNYQGEDTLGDVKFGDLETGRTFAVRHTQFLDADVDDEGFYLLLDSLRGRVFVYSAEGDLVSVFGGLGSQTGTFGTPVAVESMGSRILVLDAGKNRLHVFRPTDYAVCFRSALTTLENGDFANAKALYQQLLAYNSNNTYAYQGLGKIHDASEQYAQAMRYYRLAENREAYSEAFRDYRKIFVKRHFIVLALLLAASVAVLAAAARILSGKIRKTERGAYSVWESKWLLPVYVLGHPAEGFSQLRQRKTQSAAIAGGIAAAWFFIRVLEFHNTGYIFNANRAIDFSLFIAMAQTVGVLALVIASNWSICTLLDGKGRLSEIVAVVCYSLTPYLGSALICILLSQALTLEESGFFLIIRAAGFLWTGLVLLVGLCGIHQYSVKKTLGSLLLTAGGILVILFLIVLLYTLVTQTLSFAHSIIQEWSLR